MPHCAALLTPLERTALRGNGLFIPINTSGLCHGSTLAPLYSQTRGGLTLTAAAAAGGGCEELQGTSAFGDLTCSLDHS